MMLETLARPRPVSMKSDQPVQEPSGYPRQQNTHLKGLRYAFEGALVAVAMTGILGIDGKANHIHLELVAAAIGFAAVMVTRFIFLRLK